MTPRRTPTLVEKPQTKQETRSGRSQTPARHPPPHTPTHHRQPYPAERTATPPQQGANRRYRSTHQPRHQTIPKARYSTRQNTQDDGTRSRHTSRQSAARQQQRKGQPPTVTASGDIQTLSPHKPAADTHATTRSLLAKLHVAANRRRPLKQALKTLIGRRVALYDGHKLPKPLIAHLDDDRRHHRKRSRPSSLATAHALTKHETAHNNLLQPRFASNNTAMIP